MTIGTATEGRPDIILCSGGAEPGGTDLAGAGDVPVLTLSDSIDAAAAGAGAVYRYDRERIMATIADIASREAARSAA